MAKISNTLSYPNQLPIESGDYLIGTAANSTPIEKQTKTFTLGDIANFIIDEAFDGCSYRIPIFTSSSSGQESFKLVNSLFYQDVATTNAKDACQAPSGTIVYLDNGSGVGSLSIAQNLTVGLDSSLLGNLTVSGITTLGGDTKLLGPVYDANNQVGNNEQVLVSDASGNVTWQNFQGSGLEFQGTWDADTNTPDLQAISLIPGNTGKYWVVSVAGTTDLSGITDWEPQDWAIISEDDAGNVFWAKIDNSPVITGQGTPGNITLWTGTREIGDAPIVISPIPGGTSLNFNDTANNSVNGGQSNVFGSGNSISDDFALLGGQSNSLSANHSIGWGSSLTIEGSSVAAFGESNTVDADYSITAGQLNNNTGVSSAVFGKGNTASAPHTFVAGKGNSATGEYAFVFGNENQATGINSFAGGQQSVASGELSFAFGGQSTASASQSFAIGNSEANATNAFAGGGGSTASGVNTFGYGDSVVASGRAGITGGTSTVNAADYSVVVGNTSTALSTAEHSAVFGKGNSVASPGSIVSGFENVISSGGENSVALGYQNSISVSGNDGAFATGSNNIVNAASSAAIGKENNAYGTESILAGQGNEVASGATRSIAMGSGNVVAGGTGAVALGISSQASTNGAIAIGTQAIAQTGTGAVAIGTTPNAQGQDSLALGLAAVTGQTAQNAVAIGNQATATNTDAIAIGINTAASGQYSTALGRTAQATGTGSVAIGSAAVSNGTDSLALIGGTANAEGSIAGGSGSLANSAYSVALGRNNNIVEDQGQGHLALGYQNNVNDIAVADPGDGNFAIGSGNTTSGNVGVLGEGNTLQVLTGGTVKKTLAFGNNIAPTTTRNGAIYIGNDLTYDGQNNTINIGGGNYVSFIDETNTETVRVTEDSTRFGHVGVYIGSTTAPVMLGQGELLVDSTTTIKGHLDLDQPNDSTIAGNNAGNFANLTGSYNTVFGKNSLSLATTASRNTSIGFESLLNSNANNNVAIGYQTSINNITGSFNVSIGNEANANAVVQNSSVAIGYHAQKNGNPGNNNVAIGREALRDNGAASNTAVGRGSLILNTTGAENTAVGYLSLNSNTTGRWNTVLGSNAGSNITSGDNNIVIGRNATASSATVDNEITLGNSSITALRCQVQTISALSDGRDKTNVQPSPYGLDLISKLQPVTFDWNMRDGAKVGQKDLGFIAQELQKVDDENLQLVYDNNPERLEASYGRLIPVLVQAIKELKAEIDLLKS